MHAVTTLQFCLAQRGIRALEQHFRLVAAAQRLGHADRCRNGRQLGVAPLNANLRHLAAQVVKARDDILGASTRHHQGERLAAETARLVARPRPLIQ